MTDREKIAEKLEKCERCECDNCTENGASHIPWDCPAYDNLIENAIALLKEREPITGETSDGYHTFNELYHHRAVLFSVVVANYPEYSWKSKKHNDGTMYDGMFIVGIETPDGQATYHYNIDPYWDMFKCRELDKAPEWDGHTPAQAIERIGKLGKREPKPVKVIETEFGYKHYFCPNCGKWFDYKDNERKYCHRCGQEVKWNDD